VSQAISSTLDLPRVLRIVVERAVALSGTHAGAIYVYDPDERTFDLRATHGMSPELIAAVRDNQVQLGDTIVGRAAAEQRPLQTPDLLTEPSPTALGQQLAAAGFRALLALPLLREQEIVGALIVRRREPGQFPAETVELLQAFASQSALAIQNARLFAELAEQGRQLEEASQHKSQFLAAMSHELRTPLNAILGYAELLVDGIYGDVPPRALEVLERVQKSGQHLLGLINAVLDLSRIEAGQLVLALERYQLGEVVAAACAQVEPLVAAKGLRLSVELAPALPAGWGDPRRLTQVLVNLVGNAAKFAQAGEVGVRASLEDGAFVVSVRDSGPGIAPADQARIFEQFQQAAGAPPSEGAGLGLAIAKRIVELHGGRIWVESTPGQGATFTFSLPLRVEAPA
jgi:signal transduction histidine kinase